MKEPDQQSDVSEIEQYRELAYRNYNERLSGAEALFLIGWTSGTGLAALYLTRYITGTGAQVIGGVLLWCLLFSVPLLIAHLATNS